MSRVDCNKNNEASLRVQEGAARKKRKVGNTSMVIAVGDHNTPGIHSHGAQEQLPGHGGDWSCDSCTTINKCYSCRCEACGRSRRFKKKEILEVQWDHYGSNRTIVANQPILFIRDHGPTESLREMANSLYDELQIRMTMDKDNLQHSDFFEGSPISNESRVYWKSHLTNDFVKGKMLDQLPAGLSVKDNATQKGIAFLNFEQSKCDTHYDRDTSILIVMSGSKHVFLAAPNELMAKCERAENNSTYLQDINPFEEEKRGKWEWLECRVTAGNALLIPQGWIHAIRSVQSTVAISLQVETSTNNKC